MAEFVFFSFSGKFSCIVIDKNVKLLNFIRYEKQNTGQLSILVSYVHTQKVIIKNKKNSSLNSPPIA